jgi:hypothetical protein
MFGVSGGTIVAKAIDTDDRQRWRGYLSEVGSEAERTPLTEDLIKSHVSAWKRDLLNPENPAMKATIAEGRAAGLYRLSQFAEIRGHHT